MPSPYTTTAPASPLAQLDQATAAHDQAEHAYETARRSGCPLALFNAHNRRAQAENNLLLARAAADPKAAALTEAKRQYNEIGATTLTL